MVTLIITGGDLDYDFCQSFLENHPVDTIIAADRGMEFCYERKVTPDHIIGDFDSAKKEIVTYFRQNTRVEMEAYRSEKDATDTQIAMEKALYLGSDTIYLLGCMGGRMDHFLSILQLLKITLDEGCQAYLVDSQNMISLIDAPITIEKKEQEGKYVSFLPFTDQVTGITLTGFKYSLNRYTMEKGSSIGISNEIQADTAKVDFSDGILIMVQSKDK